MPKVLERYFDEGALLVLGRHIATAEVIDTFIAVK